jgi:hypothetical protein
MQAWAGTVAHREGFPGRLPSRFFFLELFLSILKLIHLSNCSRTIESVGFILASVRPIRLSGELRPWAIAGVHSWPRKNGDDALVLLVQTQRPGVLSSHRRRGRRLPVQRRRGHRRPFWSPTLRTDVAASQPSDYHPRVWYPFAVKIGAVGLTGAGSAQVRVRSGPFTFF